MVKIYQRPDPPPPDVDSNRAVRKSETFLNREASAGLFQRALVKAQGQEQAIEYSQHDELGHQHQMESDAGSVASTKSKESTLASQSEANEGASSAPTEERSAVEAADAKVNENVDVVEQEEMPDDSTEVDITDKAEHESDVADSPVGPDSTAVYQLFENIRDLGERAETAPQADTESSSDNVVNTQQETSETASTAVAHSAAATAASMESRIDSMSSMSDIIDMLETTSPLQDGNEWTLILEDDGPVSELTLTSDAEGRWNIDLLTSFNNDVVKNEAVKDELIGNLRNQLDTAGIAVADIALVDTSPMDAVSGKQTSAMDSDTSKPT